MVILRYWDLIRATKYLAIVRKRLSVDTAVSKSSNYDLWSTSERILTVIIYHKTQYTSHISFALRFQAHNTKHYVPKCIEIL